MHFAELGKHSQLPPKAFLSALRAAPIINKLSRTKVEAIHILEHQSRLNTKWSKELRVKVVAWRINLDTSSSMPEIWDGNAS